MDDLDVNSFKKKMESIDKKMSKLMIERSNLVKACIHHSLPKTYRELSAANLPEYFKKKYGSNTGNYDPHEDCYWIDMECTICGSKWWVDK